MTLANLLTKAKKHGSTVRVFAGCMTIYKGNPSVISVSEWIKVQPYFNCKILNHKVMNDTIVITI